MLIEQLNNDIKQAMRDKDSKKLGVLRMFLSALQYEALSNNEKKEEATDETVIKVLQREIKKRNESIKLYEQGGRPELAEAEQYEIDILKDYLPEQLSEEDLKKTVQEAISTTGASSIKDMGNVMKEIMSKVQGKADGQTVSKIVKELLQ